MFRAPAHVETVIVGAGQAGLSTAHHLAALGRPFVILEARARVGDVWRERFDSLRLYSPAKYDALPGLPMDLDPWTYPGKDQVADYLGAYAEHLGLPVVTGARVDRVRRDGDGFVVGYADAELHADNVVI